MGNVHSECQLSPRLRGRDVPALKFRQSKSKFQVSGVIGAYAALVPGLRGHIEPLRPFSRCNMLFLLDSVCCPGP